jgi:hypothetical protein
MRHSTLYVYSTNIEPENLSVEQSSIDNLRSLKKQEEEKEEEEEKKEKKKKN